MNKKICKFIMILIMFIALLLTFDQNYSYAASNSTTNTTSNSTAGTSGKSLVDNFDGTSTATGDGEEIIQKVIGTILSAVRIIATGIAIIVITYLGIKYMSAAPTEKANIKNQLITFVIGAIVVFGTTSLLDLIKKLATNATTV